MSTSTRHESVPIEPAPTNDQEIEEILENIPSEIEISVDLPSRNKFYNLSDPSSPVTVRPMTFEDEKVLASNTSRDKGINLLLERCVTNVSITQLLLMDKLYLLLKIREVSFGSSYTVSHICPSCQKENELTFEIADFKVTYIPEDLEDPREIELPTLQKTALIRLPRVADEEFIGSVDLLFDNLWRFVKEIAGNKKRAVISKVIQRLPSKDFHIISNAIFDSKYGIDLKGKYACDSCQTVNIAEIPITENFFSPS